MNRMINQIENLVKLQGTQANKNRTKNTKPKHICDSSLNMSVGLDLEGGRCERG